jgi:hypothetical protein
MAAIPGKTQGQSTLFLLICGPNFAANLIVRTENQLAAGWWGWARPDVEAGKSGEMKNYQSFREINDGIIKSLIQSLQQSPKKSLPKTHPKRDAGCLSSEVEWGSFGGGILHRL